MMNMGKYAAAASAASVAAGKLYMEEGSHIKSHCRQLHHDIEPLQAAAAAAVAAATKKPGYF